MDPQTLAALDRSQLIDLTTTGRQSGQARRIEIFLHNLAGRLVISGVPSRERTRAWLRNVEANPSVTLHLKQRLQADVPATARVVTDPEERRRLLEGVAANWGRTDLDMMQAHSPLIEVSVAGYPR
ncbi:MAG: nitroreductase family deazaflavin-dependent oxidoreductase [Candidatus Limnocylindrales bacterium]